jgi:hypothetical protein
MQTKTEFCIAAERSSAKGKACALPLQKANLATERPFRLYFLSLLLPTRGKLFPPHPYPPAQGELFTLPHRGEGTFFLYLRQGFGISSIPISIFAIEKWAIY